LNEPGSGKVSIAEDLESGTIPREDVAQTILTALTMENTFNRSFDLVSGEQLISDALNKI
jgi:hypothetical protein